MAVATIRSFPQALLGETTAQFHIQGVKPNLLALVKGHELASRVASAASSVASSRSSSASSSPSLSPAPTKEYVAVAKPIPVSPQFFPSPSPSSSPQQALPFSLAPQASTVQQSVYTTFQPQLQRAVDSNPLRHLNPLLAWVHGKNVIPNISTDVMRFIWEIRIKRLIECWTATASQQRLNPSSYQPHFYHPDHQLLWECYQNLLTCYRRYKGKGGQIRIDWDPRNIRPDFFEQIYLIQPMVQSIFLC